MPSLPLGGAGPTGPGGATFDPLTLSPLVWYKADAGLLDASDVAITVDATAIKTWQDQSGNGRHLTQGTAGSRPLAKLNIQNGLPVVRMDGTDDNLLQAAGANFITSNSINVFIVAIRRAAKNNAGAMSLYAAADADDFQGNARCIIGFEGASSTQHACYRNGQEAVIASHPGNDVPFLLTARFDNSNNNLRRDSTDATAVADTKGAFACSRVLIGARWIASALAQFNQYDYCEALVFNSDLASGDRTSVQTYLKNKWGTP